MCELRCLGYKLAVGWTNRPLALGDMTILDTYISAVGEVKRTADQIASLQRWRRRENFMWVSGLLRADGRTLRARFGKRLRQKVDNLEDDSMRLSSIAFGTGLTEPAVAPRVGFMTRAAWGRVREGEFIWHDGTVCEVMSVSRDEVRLRSYVNMTMGISTRDKRLEFCAGEESSISVDAQLFLVDDVVVREDGRLLITDDEMRVVRAAASRFTDESESSGSESERDTFNMDTQHGAVTDHSCITQAHENAALGVALR